MLYLLAALNAALVAIVVSALWLVFGLVRDERDTAGAERNATAAAMDRERATWAAERADLLQRIQAPAEAVVQHAMAAPVQSMPAVVQLDDDEAHWEAQQAQMTKEELAARMFAQELAEA